VGTAQAISSADTLAQVWAAITSPGGSAGTVLGAKVVTVASGLAAGTYLYVDSNANNVVATTDFLVNITGVTGTITAADFVFS
jgi:hypothetical protein